MRLTNPDEQFRPNPAQSAEWNRGAYLAEAMGHCGECHTPRNLAYALNNRSKFAGALTAGWRAYNISADKDSGLGNWTDADLATYLSTGHADGHGGSAGPMGEATDNSLTFLTPGDIHALVVYLRSVPERSTDLPRNGGETPAPASHKEGAPDEVNSRGEMIFAGACAACHDWTGVSPTNHYATLTGVRAVNDPSATNVAQTVINGVNRQTARGPIFMPSFGEAYSDDDIAAVSNYVTARFGAEGAKSDCQRCRQPAQAGGTTVRNRRHAMPTETEIKFAQSDAYTTELMRQVRAAPQQGGLADGPAHFLQAGRRGRRGAGDRLQSAERSLCHRDGDHRQSA